MTRLIVVLALLSGCSVVLQSKPSRASATCSTTPAFWIADSVGAAAGAAAIATGLAMGPSDGANAIAGAGVIAGIVYLASAHNGYKWARGCREAPAVAAR